MARFRTACRVFQHVENASCAGNSTARGMQRLSRARIGIMSAMFDAMERGELTTLYVVGREPRGFGGGTGTAR